MILRLFLKWRVQHRTGKRIFTGNPQPGSKVFFYIFYKKPSYDCVQSLILLNSISPPRLAQFFGLCPSSMPPCLWSRSIKSVLDTHCRIVDFQVTLIPIKIKFCLDHLLFGIERPENSGGLSDEWGPSNRD